MKFQWWRHTFAELCDICEVLELFSSGAVNPNFIRQLAAFQMLKDDLQLRLTDGTTPVPGAKGSARTHLVHAASAFDMPRRSGNERLISAHSFQGLRLNGAL